MKGCEEVSRWPTPRKRRKKKEIHQVRNQLLRRYDETIVQLKWTVIGDSVQTGNFGLQM